MLRLTLTRMPTRERSCRLGQPDVTFRESRGPTGIGAVSIPPTVSMTAPAGGTVDELEPCNTMG